MKAGASLVIVLIAALTGACGRQERIISITSDPPGAIVWLNDYELGRTPVEAEFKFFGVYDLRLVKEGCEPLLTSREAVAPLHEYPGVDLIATAIPGTRRTHLQWHFVLAPLAEAADRAGAEAALMQRARQFGAEAAAAPQAAPAQAGGGTP